jgi:hypothetical protein
MATTQNFPFATSIQGYQPFRNPGSMPRTLDLAGGLRGRLTTLGPVAPAAAPTCMLEEKGAPKVKAEREPLPPVVFVDVDPAPRFGFNGDSTLLLCVLLPELVELCALSLRMAAPGVFRFVSEEPVGWPLAPPKGLFVVEPLAKWKPPTAWNCPLSPIWANRRAFSCLFCTARKSVPGDSEIGRCQLYFRYQD